MIILDTNVISELMKADPSQSVMRWLAAQKASGLYTTSITKAEILHGILLLPPGKRRTAFLATADEMFSKEFNARVLAFDSASAHEYARIASTRSRVGRPISHFDAQIAAIASATGAVIATRNVRDFEHCNIALINPWAGSSELR